MVFEVSLEEDFFQNKLQQMKRNKICWCCSGVVFIVILGLFGGSFRRVGPYHYGILKNTATGVVHLDNGPDSVYEPGIYFAGFWNDFIVFPKTLATISYSSEAPEEGVQRISPLILRSRNRVSMTLEISVQYRRKKDKLVDLFKRAMTDALQENIVISVLRAELTKVMSKHESTDCWMKRAELIQDFYAACKRVLNEVFVECFELQFYRSYMSSKFEAALVNTQVQKQQQRIEEAKQKAVTVRSQTEVELEATRKDIQVYESLEKANRYRLRVSTRTQAEADKVSAESNVTDMLFTQIKLDNGTPLNGKQLAQYQQILMLGREMVNVPLYYGFKNAPDYVAAPSKTGRRLVTKPSVESQDFLPDPNLGDTEGGEL